MDEHRVSLWTLERSIGLHRDTLERLCSRASIPIERAEAGRLARRIAADRIPELLEAARAWVDRPRRPRPPRRKRWPYRLTRGRRPGSSPADVGSGRSGPSSPMPPATAWPPSPATIAATEVRPDGRPG